MVSGVLPTKRGADSPMKETGIFKEINLETCTSTMDSAKEMSTHFKNQAFYVSTKIQTQGRGRGGSTWTQAPKAQTETDFLPSTFAIPSHLIKIPFEWLSILVGCALYDSLKKCFEVANNLTLHTKVNLEWRDLVIKWPNDILFKETEKKISGILCESSSIDGKIQWFYIGIGLNLFFHPDLQNSDSFFPSRFSEKLNSNIKLLIVNEFKKFLFEEIHEYLFNSRSISQLKSLAKERMVPIGTTLSVNKRSQKGKFADLGDNGSLILEGITEPIFSGDVHIEKEIPITPKKIKTIENLNQIKKISESSTPKKKSKPIIAVDFGNTRIHLTSQNSLKNIYSCDLLYNDDLTNTKIELKSLLENIQTDRQETIDFFYCSVIKKEKTIEYIEKLKSFLKFYFPEIKFQCSQISESDVFSRVQVKGNFETSRLGTDRALKFYFAQKKSEILKSNILVFSFGTAVTCEGISAQGEILENFVSPGIQMSFNSMHDYTALLPLFSPKPDLFFPENKFWNQEIYMQRGVFMGVVGSILTTAQIHQPCQCYLSGGNADQVASIINILCHKLNISIKIEVVKGIETQVLLDIANDFQPKKNTSESTNKVQSEHKSIQTVLESMAKARILEKDRRNIEPRLEEFKRIGGRIENSNEDRFDQHMASKYKFYNREEWRNKILNGEVMIEHNASREIDPSIKPELNKLKPTYKIKNFDQIWLFRPPEYEPEFLDKIDVLYDNKDLCVFAKPPNLVVHAAGLYLKNTFIEHISKMGYKDCSPVHRIDRETSGLLVCARKAETRNALSEAFRNSHAKKLYLAVTKGTRNVPDSFKVDLPIGQPENSLIRLKLWVTGTNLQPACTYFQRLAQVEDYSIFACVPITGRTNQIRIHLAAIGQWIIGDKMYHKDEKVFIDFYENGYTPWVHENVLFPRHMLHNTGIMFEENLNIDPLSFEPMICPIPEDMLAFPKVRELMEKANIPVKEDLQVKKLKELFISLHGNNLSKEETVYEE